MTTPTGRSRGEPSTAWAGWVGFASIVLVLTGCLDMLQGVIALAQDEYFVVGEDELLVFDFTTWGVLLLMWGLLLVLAGFGLQSGRGWARWFAIILTFVNAIAQIGFLAAYPIWSTIVIALDVVVLYALTAGWAEAQLALRD